jgi:hypothetical protein
MNLRSFVLLLMALPAAAADVCALLPEKAVRDIFAIPAATKVNMAQADSCTYAWWGAHPTERDLRDAYMANKPRPRRPGESVSVRLEPMAKAEAELGQRYGMLSKGYKLQRDGAELEVKPQKLEWVDGLPGRAFWNATLGQLVAVHKEGLISVQVRKGTLSAAALRDAAVTTAQFVLRKQ